MSGNIDIQILPEDRRFARFEAIKWWDQARLARARILVVGAGALGNETIKNLALLGVGHLLIVDMDRIEITNLCRSVLFRETDMGAPKAAVAARAAIELYPGVDAKALVGNIQSDIGLGCFRWADVVVGCLDNREARVFVNRACAQVGRPWIDGGIDVLGGVVRGFAPPETSCYECTMGQADWDQLAKRRSCSLLARAALAEGGVPTTPTTASIIGAMQAQEVVKRLHGLESLSGRGYVFEGLTHSSYTVDYPVAPDCPWHEAPPPVKCCDEFNADTQMGAIRHHAVEMLGGLDAVDLSREIVEALDCTACGQTSEVMKPIEHVTEEIAVCRSCGAECVPRYVHSLSPDSALWNLTVRELGLPAWDIVWARNGEDIVGIELSGDRFPDPPQTS